jgi:tetratricopeptide (TPR) repeat protein
MWKGLGAAWVALIGAAIATRLASALQSPLLRGYDAVGHVSYVFFLDLYRAVPFADQGWSYFHPPLHYALGWLLAQAGRAEVLVRGLSLWGGLASLAIAGLSARIVARRLPGHSGLPWLAFASVAFLPVHLYASPMPGNELTLTLCVTAAVALHVANAARAGGGSSGRHAATGALLGLALLTKYSGLLALLAILAELGLRGLRVRAERGRLVRQAVVIATTALALSGSYYARNAVELGTPFPLAGQRPVVDAFERGQPPGERGLADLVRVSPRLFADPDPRAQHMLHSIWGTAWAGMWVHLDPDEAGLAPHQLRALLALGVLPSLLAAWGFGLALARVARDPEARLEATLVLLTGVCLSAFASFAYRVPTFAALKAQYLLSLSPAWAFYLARALVALDGRRPLQRVAAAAAGLPLAYAAWVYWPEPGRAGERDADMARVYAHFGQWPEARAIYRRALAAALAPGHPTDPQRPRLNPFWLREMLAAVELESDRQAEAAALYRESLALRAQGAGPGSMGADSPFVANRLAVAEALDGALDAARQRLDAVLERKRYPEFLASRGALRAAAGERDAARRDLAAALELEPDLAAALETRAWLADDAAAVAAARRAAARAPRAYPYGVGDGRGLNTQLPMLVWRDGALALYRPARAHPRGAG